MIEPIITKQITTIPCPCEGTRKDCRMCDGKGTYEDYRYFIEVNGIAIDMDTLK